MSLHCSVKVKNGLEYCSFKPTKQYEGKTYCTFHYNKVSGNAPTSRRKERKTYEDADLPLNEKVIKLVETAIKNTNKEGAKKAMEKGLDKIKALKSTIKIKDIPFKQKGTLYNRIANLIEGKSPSPRRKRDYDSEEEKPVSKNVNQKLIEYMKELMEEYGETSRNYERLKNRINRIKDLDRPAIMKDMNLDPKVVPKMYQRLEDKIKELKETPEEEPKLFDSDDEEEEEEELILDDLKEKVIKRLEQTVKESRNKKVAAKYNEYIDLIKKMKEKLTLENLPLENKASQTYKDIEAMFGKKPEVEIVVTKESLNEKIIAFLDEKLQSSTSELNKKNYKKLIEMVQSLDRDAEEDDFSAIKKATNLYNPIVDMITESVKIDEDIDKQREEKRKSEKKKREEEEKREEEKRKKEEKKREEEEKKKKEEDEKRKKEEKKKREEEEEEEEEKKKSEKKKKKEEEEKRKKEEKKREEEEEKENVIKKAKHVDVENCDEHSEKDLIKIMKALHLFYDKDTTRQQMCEAIFKHNLQNVIQELKQKDLKCKGEECKEDRIQFWKNHFIMKLKNHKLLKKTFVDFIEKGEVDRRFIRNLINMFYCIFPILHDYYDSDEEEQVEILNVFRKEIYNKLPNYSIDELLDYGLKPHWDYVDKKPKSPKRLPSPQREERLTEVITLPEEIEVPVRRISSPKQRTPSPKVQEAVLFEEDEVLESPKRRTPSPKTPMTPDEIKQSKIYSKSDLNDIVSQYKNYVDENDLKKLEKQLKNAKSEDDLNDFKSKLETFFETLVQVKSESDQQLNMKKKELKEMISKSNLKDDVKLDYNKLINSLETEKDVDDYKKSVMEEIEKAKKTSGKKISVRKTSDKSFDILKQKSPEKKT